MKSADLEEPPPTAATKVLIVDDHAIVREGLTELLRGEPGMEVCGEAGSAELALELILADEPDLVILDVMLGGVSGIELIKNIRAAGSKVRVLVLSMHDEAHYAERALRAGASGYIMKREARSLLLTAVRTVSQGRDYVSDAMQKSMVHRYLHGAWADEESPLKKLSDREMEVLSMLGRNQTSKEIAGRLHLSQKTVDTHRTHIKKKLGIDTASELTRFAVEWLAERTSA